METLLGIALGIGLAAACGFRVFVPLLVMSLAALSGHLSLSQGFEWIGSPVACLVFAVATLLEVGAYWIPWLDNLLDTAAAPAAVVAGIVVTAATVSDMSPLLSWSLAIIAGGGAAAVVQTATSLARGASTLMTGGLANPLFSTAEAGVSALLASLAVLAPLVAVVVVLGLFVWAARHLARRRKTGARAPSASR